jgi:GT2 family glycosyltransferase
VTPVHNRRDLTLQCLRSLQRCDTQGIDLRVIVVDDGSTDGTAEAIARDFPNVQVVAGDGSLWFSEGTNVGAREGLRQGADYILMMNDDQVFDANFLRYLVETAEANPRSVVGPLLLLWDTPHKLFQTSPRWETLSGGWRHWQNQTVWTVPKSPWEVEAIVGNCVLVPATAIRENGLLNSQRYPNFGDAEYTPRLRKAGWKLIVDPRSRVFCQPNNLPAKVLKMSIREKANALIFDLRHVQNLRRRLYGYVDGAPTKLHGLAAFFIFFARHLARRNTESAQFASRFAEPAIAETFADKVIR